MRIIAGQWRGRLLQVASVEGLRPTPNRVRETLFNWLLNTIENSVCLDAFAGSGALGFEALSRSARRVDFIDNSPTAIKTLNENAKRLNCQGANIIHSNTLIQLEKKATQPYDIIFLDPPFHKNLITPCYNLLNKNNYLKETSLVYIETAIDESAQKLPSNWQVKKQKKHGSVLSSLYLIKLTMGV